MMLFILYGPTNIRRNNRIFLGDLNGLAFFVRAKGAERMSLDVDAFLNKNHTAAAFIQNENLETCCTRLYTEDIRCKGLE